MQPQLTALSWVWGTAMAAVMGRELSSERV